MPRRWLITALVPALALAGCGGSSEGDSPGDRARGGKSDAAAAKLLYESLGNAAGQPVLRVGMFRATFPTKADAEAARDPSTESSTVSKLDSRQADYRAVYATRLGPGEPFTIGRCIDGADYRDFANRGAARPKTLDRAAAGLRQLQRATARLPFSPCPGAGVYPSGSTDIAAARLSDGVMPVTLSRPQARAWTRAVTAANLFTVTDQGTVSRDGARLRKLAFKPRAGVGDANQRLYDIFYRAGDIRTLERRRRSDPRVTFAYEFISIGVARHGGVEGHYLIDERRRLPVYSELYGTGASGGATGTGGRSRASEWARTKQSYAFGGRLSLTESSGLEFTSP